MTLGKVCFTLQILKGQAKGDSVLGSCSLSTTLYVMGLYVGSSCSPLAFTSFGGLKIYLAMLDKGLGQSLNFT